MHRICAGDIGVHFSPDDPRWKGADSAIFVRHALESFQSQGWRIEHVNLTIVAQVPKIKPHREAMRKNVAQLWGIALDRVNIQATTEEEMGYTGRLEGLRAKALVTARRPFLLGRWWRGRSMDRRIVSL
ncbi:MAG: 2-C-methyl-D-erythritol 2,4-cyclodiphosphate synthase [Alphaproteobacteria bacterium]|nr:MAG: 2-C-methyl-D-erythritol 2,4-cyclodiphosphate synthase [Alphaproteobacteria bacterium]